MADVRVIAARLHGDGTETILDPEVPLTDLQVEPFLNAGYNIDGQISPVYMSQIAPDGKPFIEAWSTALYVEEDGQITAGGIVTEDSYDDQTRTLSTTGFADYPAGQAYVGSWVSTALDQAKHRVRTFDLRREAAENQLDQLERAFAAAVAYWSSLPGPSSPKPGGGGDQASTWQTKKKAEQDMANAKMARDRAAVALDSILSQHGRDLTTLANYAETDCPTFTDGQDGVDPLDILRHIWNHLQSQPRGDIGMVVDKTASPVRIGQSIAATEYDDDNDGDTPEFEYGEYRLAWYETTDLGEKVMELVENTPFEFWEEHSWNADRTAIEHRLRMAYPRAGAKRDDVRLVIGENIQIPAYANEGSTEYASELLALGAGQGGTDISANASGRLHAVIHRDGEHRIRRCMPFDDPSRASAGSLAAAARNQLKAHTGHYALTSLEVIPGRDDDLRALRIGDWVRVLGDLGWTEVDAWCRITSIAYSPQDGATLSFGVEPI